MLENVTALADMYFEDEPKYKYELKLNSRSNRRYSFENKSIYF